GVPQLVPRLGQLRLQLDRLAVGDLGAWPVSRSGKGQSFIVLCFATDVGRRLGFGRRQVLATARGPYRSVQSKHAYRHENRTSHPRPPHWSVMLWGIGIEGSRDQGSEGSRDRGIEGSRDQGIEGSRDRGIEWSRNRCARALGG